MSRGFEIQVSTRFTGNENLFLENSHLFPQLSTFELLVTHILHDLVSNGVGFLRKHDGLVLVTIELVHGLFLIMHE